MPLRFLILVEIALLPLMATAFDPAKNDDDRKITISSASSDDEIRRTLLRHTPHRTSAVDVFTFVVESLPRLEPVNAYSEYVKAYEKSTGKKSGATPTNSRNINATVARRLVGLLSSEVVEAKWHFDDKDQLTDITIRRYSFGP